MLEDFSRRSAMGNDVYFRALAAAELRRYLSQMTGHDETDVSIVDDRVSVIGNILFVGLPGEHSSYADMRSVLLRRWRKTKNKNAQGMRFDTFQQEQRSVLAISGRSAVATLYAAYDWLEQQGVRWIAPDEGAEIVPVRSGITVQPCDLYREPAMTLRGYIPGCAQAESFKSGSSLLRWLLRNRINLLAAEARADSLLHGYGIRAVRNIVPDVKRQSGFNEICLGHPESLKQFIDSLLTAAAPWPDLLIFDAAKIEKWCDCAVCAQMGNATDKSLALLAQIGEMMETVQQDNRGVETVELLGIVGSKIPEKAIPENWNDQRIKLAVHVFPRCFDHSMTDANCTEVNYKILQTLSYWLNEKAIGEVGIIEGYHAAEFAGLPLVLSERLHEDIPFYVDIGIKFLLSHQPEFSYPGTNALLDYQMARQCWRGEVDLDTLESEYFAVYYPGIPERMQEFYRILQEALANIVAWRFELPQKLDQMAQQDFTEPLLPLDLFRNHFLLGNRFAEENLGTDWERTYQLIHDARRLLDETMMQSVPDQTVDHLIALEAQLRFAEMTITLYDNVIRVLTLSKDEPEMREEAAIRLRETTRKMAEFKLPQHPCGEITALNACGISDACQKLCRVLDEHYGPAYERIYE
ncbi:hypothetical protein JXO59_03240 [candidate division KSB1 bacterium]|nr:hypothetical protein [candidate division KSB1 bacterium]